MPNANFPFGVRSYGVPVVPGSPAPGYGIGVGGKGNVTATNTGSTITPGPGSQVFFVNSALATAADAAVSQGNDPLRPFKTINFALGQTLANNGDVVYVGPGHVETIAAAAGWPNAAASLRADGVTIYFLGSELDRAQINFTTSTAAQIIIGANNMTLVGARILNSKDALVTAFSVTGTDCKFVGCEYADGPAFNTLIQIKTTAAAKRLSVIGYHYYEDQTGGGTTKTEAIRIVGGDNHLLQDCNVQGTFSTGNINNITTAMICVLVKNCTFNNLGSAVAFAQLTTSSVSFIGTCLATTTGADAISAGNLALDSSDAATSECIAGVPALINFTT